MKATHFMINENLIVEYLYVKKYLLFFKKKKWIEYPYWSKFENKEDAEKAIEKEVSYYNRYNKKFKMPFFNKKKCCGMPISMISFSILIGYNKESYYKKNITDFQCKFCKKKFEIVS